MKLLIITLSFLSVTIASYSQENFSYQSAQPNYTLTFPKDHGSHDKFKTEWWYLTGHLFDKNTADFFKDSPKFGFQLTFFRASDSGKNGFLAHGALSDFSQNTHMHSSNHASSLPDLAGVSNGFLNVWNRKWYLKAIGDKFLASYKLEDGTQVNLLLEPNSSPILQGINGFSKKAICDECASHYYSFPNMKVTAQIFFPIGESKTYYGVSWYDHEFMSNSLQENQVGWDWFSLQLQDQRQLMLFKVRGKNSKDDFYSGTLIDSKNNTTINLDKSDFSIEVLSTWKSDKSKAKYPSKWNIKLSKYNINLDLSTRIPNQELNFEGQAVNAYYEGSIIEKNNKAIGYVEMTGYSSDIGKIL
jgi:predicted secreted hydrolase